MVKNAVVVGGSLAGLMHGIMLQRHGYNVTILEQDNSVMRHGLDAGIRVGPDAVAFMRKFDRTKRDFIIHLTRTHVVKRDGKDSLLSFPHPLDMTSWGLTWSILRANFEDQPSGVAPDAPEKPDIAGGISVYHRGARVTNVHEDGDIVKVQYEDMATGSTNLLIADFVVAADGANSAVRRLLMPDVQRQYVGYVSWRGTVKASLMSSESLKMFGGQFTLHYMNKSSIVIYIIPTDDGDMGPGDRLCNWVWYCNLPEGSPELEATMTDVNGKTHYGTVPRKLIQPGIWEKQKQVAASQMPTAISELIAKTKNPFVTRIHEVAPKKASFFSDKLVLVGDALCGFRPHIALSTNQAAFDCLALEEVIEGKKNMRKWERMVVNYGRQYRSLSAVLGTFAQSSRTAFVWRLIRHIFLVLGLKTGIA